MRMLMVDHNDSFTFNLVDAFRVLGNEVNVVRYAKLDPASWNLDNRLRWTGEDLEALVLSPGPGRPADYPKTRALLDQWPADRPLLGICLGMQLLNEWSGGKTIYAPQVVHGKTCPIFHDVRGIFEGLPTPCTVMRYHSLACHVTSPEWGVCARSEDHIPMAMRHRTRPWWGLQFHPESFMTSTGQKMLENWILNVSRIFGGRI
jgi:anthranilate synthase/aminodeoxychorismate synthase-like glutamine amidotransferase